MPHVASTLTCNNIYAEYHNSGTGAPIRGHQVEIKGGHGMADKNFVTPTGAVLTEVTDEDVAMLEKCPAFIEHQKGGFVHILKRKVDGEKIVSDMKTRDGSAPLTPAHFKDKDPNDPSVLSVNSGARA